MARGKAKAKARSRRPSLAPARALPSTREVTPAARRRAWIDVALGTVLVLGGAIVALGQAPASQVELATFVIAFLPLAAALLIARGAATLDRRVEQPMRADRRQLIYGCLAIVLAGAYAYCIGNVIPNRLPHALLHLTSIPVLAVGLGAGTLLGGRYGWWLAVIAGSLMLLSTIAIIARILISAAFLAGVYGAFGKAAATFALVAVALIVEVVGLLPICAVRFLMSRSGRRAYGV
ncbi:MAG TPA: hypothetical protein VFQ53_06495 [Kofleriaceae bacterium]|nr:hypothetical protein [Kofleriaceae bacterium]